MSRNLKRFTVLALIAVIVAAVCLLGVGQKDGWYEEGDGWFFYKEGNLRQGWVNDRDKWYYTDAETGKMLTGWQQISEEWYYFRASGSMVTGWQFINSNWYSFKTNGKMRTGWLTDNGKTYYLRGSGSMATGWQKVDDIWYYFTKSNGAMKTGWHSSNNTWYYLQSDGKMAVGWTTVQGKNYYFKADGSMAVNTEVDGRRLGSNGAEVTGNTDSGDNSSDNSNDDNGSNDNTSTPPPDSQQGSLAGKIIGIDPGHQGKGNSAKEPQAPGSSTMKAKVTSGTRGVYSKTYEHVINLQAGLALRDKLQAEGATVIMTRTSADVDISNAERAKMMNEAKADLVIRLHADGAESSSANGVSVLVPSGQYVTAIKAESRKAGELVLEEYVKATGARNRGISERSDQTGFNWSTVPVINIEMGFMSNKEEDMKLNDANYRDKAMTGVVKGVKRYFGV